MILTLVFCADRDCWMDELNAGMDQGTLTELGLRTPLSLSLLLRREAEARRYPCRSRVAKKPGQLCSQPHQMNSHFFCNPRATF